MVPDYAPSMFSSKCEGEGFNLVLYLQLTPQARERLQNLPKHSEPNVELVNAVRLLRNFILASEGEEVRKRFKGIARLVNVEEADLNSAAKKLVKSYNGTPFLIRTTSTFYRGKNYFEVDVDVHRFGYLSRFGLSNVKDRLKTCVADIGFVIQGNEDEELPEQMLGCCRLFKIDIQNVAHFPAALLECVPPWQMPSSS